MGKSFRIKINVVNGEVKEFPEYFVFNCSTVVPIGMTTIRYFNQDMCSIAHRTFYLRVGQELLGTNQFRTIDDFNKFTSMVCYDYNSVIDGCNILIDGEQVNFL